MKGKIHIAFRLRNDKERFCCVEFFDSVEGGLELLIVALKRIQAKYESGKWGELVEFVIDGRAEQ